MAITTAVCTSFKEELANAIHDFDNDTFKLALYTNSANLDANTTQYTTSGEVVGSGYTSGGKIITGLTVTKSGSTVIIDFDDVLWTSSTFTTRGALLYNQSKANRTIGVWNFGTDKSAAGSDFTVIVPPATVAAAVLRIA